MRISKTSFLLILFSFRHRRIAVAIIFCLVFSYLSCERDFSPVKIIASPDTTSHDFQWEIISIESPYGSGVLRDVAIITENDIWAVGEIYADSIEPWRPYNAVHWDGQQWELKRILYQGGFWSIKSIYAFSSNDIWFDALVRWNGANFIEVPIPGILIGHTISKMWGTTSNNLYVVGSEGLIVHYDGSSWQKIESGTDLGLLDIWGVSQTEIYTVGLNYSQALGVVLKYDGIACQKMIEGFVEGNGFDPSQLFKTQLIFVLKSQEKKIFLSEKMVINFSVFLD